MLGVTNDQTGIVWFAFDGPTVGGVPTRWRSDLLHVLRAFHPCPRPEDVLLAAGELVSNGLEHGGGVRRLHVAGRRGVVTVEVEDCTTSLTGSPAASRVEGGRGLRIVDAVADSWGWWPTTGGKTVWASFLPDEQEVQQ